jgi:hypothetical protein
LLKQLKVMSEKDKMLLMSIERLIEQLEDEELKQDFEWYLNLMKL